MAYDGCALFDAKLAPALLPLHTKSVGLPSTDCPVLNLVLAWLLTLIYFAVCTYMHDN